MHRLIREHLEELLADSRSVPAAAKHLAECAECRDEVAAMQEHSALLRQWRAAEEVEPRAGFYARVMGRIEAQVPPSIWNMFFDSWFGRRIALASLALALLIGVYVVSSERIGEPELAQGGDAVEMLAPPVATFVADQDQTGALAAQGAPQGPDQDSVLVDLVTYREQ